MDLYNGEQATNPKFTAYGRIVFYPIFCSGPLLEAIIRGLKIFKNHPKFLPFLTFKPGLLLRLIRCLPAYIFDTPAGPSKTLNQGRATILIPNNPS